jgi:hypothetical protein
VAHPRYRARTLGRPAPVIITGLAKKAQAQEKAASGNPMSTRFGQLSINDENVLLFNGQHLSPEVQGNTSLEFVRNFEMGGTDVILLRDIGGTACLELYYFITITPDGDRPSPEFGSCGELLNLWRREEAILVTTRGHMGHEEPEAVQAKAAKEKRLRLPRRRGHRERQSGQMKLCEAVRRSGRSLTARL